jgi:hypothetical protein
LNNFLADNEMKKNNYNLIIKHFLQNYAAQATFPVQPWSHVQLVQSAPTNQNKVNLPATPAQLEKLLVKQAASLKMIATSLMCS